MRFPTVILEIENERNHFHTIRYDYNDVLLAVNLLTASAEVVQKLRRWHRLIVALIS